MNHVNGTETLSGTDAPFFGLSLRPTFVGMLRSPPLFFPYVHQHRSIIRSVGTVPSVGGGGVRAHTLHSFNGIDAGWVDEWVGGVGWGGGRGGRGLHLSRYRMQRPVHCGSLPIMGTDMQ